MKISGNPPSLFPRLAATVSIVLVAIALHSQSKSATQSTSTSPDENQIYRNATYGFRYQIPYGWVDRTKELQEGSEAGKTAVLIALFERPPKSTGDSVNSAVVIAVESTKDYPGLKQVEDYAASLTELVTANGFIPAGEPSAVDEEGRHLLRADFTKVINEKITMRQCTLVLLAKGQIVTFTFIAGGESEVDDLMDALHFAPAKSSSGLPHQH